MRTRSTIVLTAAVVAGLAATGVFVRPGHPTHDAQVTTGGATARVAVATKTVLEPNGLAIDPQGDVYVADSGNHVIDKITPAGVLTVVAGIAGPGGTASPGPATGSELSNPNGLAFDNAGDLLIADSGTDQVVEQVTGTTLSIVAGVLGQGGAVVPGPASATHFGGPSGLAVDSAGAVYVADSLNGVVEKIAGGAVSIVAGSPGQFGAPLAGPATASGLYDPSAVAVHGTDLYIADSGNHVVEKVDSTGTLSIVAGVLDDDGGGEKGQPTSGIPATDSDLGDPTGLAVDSAGDLFIADPSNDVVEEVDTTGTLSIVAGIAGQAGHAAAGPATASRLNAPSEVAVDGTGVLYVADTSNNTVDKIDGGTLSIFAGTGRTTPLVNVQQIASAALAGRITAVQRLMPAVSGSQWMTPTDQSTSLAILQADLDGLLALSSKIGADTSATQATADYQTIYSGFRIYALVLQQVQLAAAADDLLYGSVPQLTAAYSSLEALVSGQPQDTPAIDASLADLHARIAAITRRMQNLASTLLSYTPAPFNANRSLLRSPRAMIGSATAAAAAANQDVENVEVALGSANTTQMAAVRTRVHTSDTAVKVANNDLAVAAQEQALPDQPQ